MNEVQFNEVVTAQIQRCCDVLMCKAKEYATSDRLHNFKQASSLQRITPFQALAGMMSKHTISVYDMLTNSECYPLELWDEKITDSINYLLLLSAMVRDKDDN